MADVIVLPVIRIERGPSVIGRVRLGTTDFGNVVDLRRIRELRAFQKRCQDALGRGT